MKKELQPKPNPLDKKALALSDRARAIVIRDQKTNLQAGELRAGLVDLYKEIVSHHADAKKKSYDAWQATIAMEKRALTPVAEALKLLDCSIAAWKDECDRRQAEQDRIAREAAERAQAEALEASIEAAREEGASEDEIEAIAAQPVVPVMVRAEPVYQAAAGVETVARYHAEVTSIRELAKAVASGKVPEVYLEGNMPVLNGLARSTKGAVSIPGVKIVKETGIRTGRI